MMTQIWVNSGSGNGLVMSGTWTKVDLPSIRICGTRLRLISEEVIIHEMSLKNTFVKLLPYLSGGNELKPESKTLCHSRRREGLYNRTTEVRRLTRDSPSKLRLPTHMALTRESPRKLRLPTHMLLTRGSPRKLRLPTHMLLTRGSPRKLRLPTH